MTTMHPRRGFLRSLAALPLIGGGVTLIGNPTRAAAPLSADLMPEYTHWLAIEFARARQEIGMPRDENWFRWEGPSYDWHMSARGAGEEPSSRAPVVLAAVGCDWWVRP